ncbi:hypothetical protein J7384_17675 [Endozoicomonas sp. G2_1]|uniref:hypothetical protein n=1 Tax=Endozoicomonas sp. G2_1 TaxID=2821091 RepID=UPI001AD9D4E4|nr:hypothetical protein [Endozoicomonas sp. G2_1]MBO9492195.1 hypothetical protein [Endozoicomonas sp. G2_1]
MSEKPSWMQDEEKRADELANSPQTTNAAAPRLVKVTREPPRRQKPFYLSEPYIKTFEQLCFDQKNTPGGKKSTHLGEEALNLLFEKYGYKLKQQ